MRSRVKLRRPIRRLDRTGFLGIGPDTIGGPRQNDLDDREEREGG